MSYITTKLQPIKSYPTYQFYAKADSKSLETVDVFKICILEAFKWLRARLNNFSDLPDGILDLEPSRFNELSDEALVSFSYTNGLSIDVIYIEKKGIWSFKLSETDMGANMGTDSERPPVQGRTFNTEIAFIKQKEYVEIGVRTICSEPSDTTAECEVFRPTVVKALAENSDIRLVQSGFILDKKPLEITSKAELDRFFGIYEDACLNFPIVLVCDSKTEVKIPQAADIKIDKSTINVTGGFSFANKSFGSDLNLSVDANALKLNAKKSVQIPAEKPKKPKEKSPVSKAEPIKTKLPVFDYTSLADKLVGFAIVAFADEKFFSQISNKTRISLDHGDIVIISRKEVIERIKYTQYQNDMKSCFRALRSDIIAMTKRKQYSFGDVLFHSDAKLKDFHTKRHETDSLEEQCNIYRLEINELRSQVKEMSQHQTDMQQSAEALRIAQKKIDAIQRELESRDAAYADLLEASEKKEAAYKKNADLISFYKKQIEVAALFPTHNEDVCDWIDSNFSDSIIVTSRARSEMRKYSGALDLACLCDGIVYLNAYSQSKRNEISDDELQLYAERYKWEVQPCGKETLKMRKSDYTVTYNGEQRTLDQHIKCGVKTEELIRVYFYWDDDLKKLVIGSMPEHLATVKQST